jgi:hypothetical protein
MQWGKFVLRFRLKLLWVNNTHVVSLFIPCRPRPPGRYCAAALTLEAGDLLLIPKGSLHAFRKMTSQQLPDTDAHADLRKQLLSNPDFIYQILCVSKAWDWDFMGVTGPGISRERVTAMENAALAEKRGLQVLAPTQTTVLRNTRGHIYRPGAKDSRSLVGFPHPHHLEASGEISPESLEILSGLRPALHYIVEMQQKIEDESKADSSKAVTFNSIPDASADPTMSKIDPHGIGSYQCKLCNAELSNGYLHCVGCEDFLEQDYNICVDCFKNGYYGAFDQMDLTNEAENAAVNHCGHFTGASTLPSCKCKNKGRKCPVCKFCTGCSCKCHQSFELRYRHFLTQNLAQLLDVVNRSVAGHRIKYDGNALERLRLARKNVEDSADEKKKFCFDKRSKDSNAKEPAKKESKAKPPSKKRRREAEEPAKKDSKGTSSTKKREPETTNVAKKKAPAPKRSRSVTPASAAASSTSNPAASPGSRRSTRKPRPKNYDQEGDQEGEQELQTTVRPQEPAAAPRTCVLERLEGSENAPPSGSPLLEPGPAAGSIASSKSPDEMSAAQAMADFSMLPKPVA